MLRYISFHKEWTLPANAVVSDSEVVPSVAPRGPRMGAKVPNRSGAALSFMRGPE
jgi:hypothetical protein